MVEQEAKLLARVGLTSGIVATVEKKIVREGEHLLAAAERSVVTTEQQVAAAERSVMAGESSGRAAVSAIKEPIENSGDNLKFIFSSQSLEEAYEYATSKTKLIHFFDKPEHKLNLLIDKFGTPEKAVRAVLNEANGKLPFSGVFEDVKIVVGGHEVYIRGRIIDGIPKLGTMFIK